MTAEIRVGPAGWDYPDWKGVVYPGGKPKKFDALAYLARYFQTIEINSTFYGPATEKTAAAWVERVATNPRFRFTAKLWRRFTHERETAFTAADVAQARAAFDVLAAAGKLGAVLLQFPWSFRNDGVAHEWLGDLFGAFAGLPLVLEVRHASWSDPDVLSWLDERGVGLVNVDQPLFGSSLKPAAHATAEVGYVRLHGRNYRDWFRDKATRDERYDYLYTADELRPWVARIRDIAARPRTRQVYAVTNNHHVGKAVVNAEMIEAMLLGSRVSAPPELYARYQAALEPYAVPAAGPPSAPAAGPPLDGKF
jgi:uncharacterized protein YecE (DUF72 family)